MSRRLPIGLLLGLVAAPVAGDRNSDLRPLVELSVVQAWGFPEDRANIDIQVFRNGLLHYQEHRLWDRSEDCGASYVLALGMGTQRQLATLDAALASAQLAFLEGDCVLEHLFNTSATYHLDWVGKNGDRRNTLDFRSTEGGFDPQPTPDELCDPRLVVARDAIRQYASQVIARPATRVVRGSSCYPPR